MQKKIYLFFVVALFTATNFIHAQGTAWKTTGNSGTNVTANFIGTTDNNGVVLKTNDSERVRFGASGNVGIGTKAPKTRLHVDGGTYLNLAGGGYQTIGNINTYNLAFDPDEIQSRYNGSAMSLYLNNYGGTVYAGNSTNSTYGLYAFGASIAVVGQSAGYGVYGLGAYGMYGSGTTYGVYGYTGGGTTGTDPNDVAGVHGYNAGYGNGITGVCENGTGTVGWSTNYVGLWGYTGNSASYAGYFVGNVYSTGVFTSSDAKLKQNINDMSSGLSIISQLHPKQYTFRQDGNYKQMNLPQGQHFGLIAQDVEKVLPNLVKDSKYDVTKLVETNIPDPKDNTKKITTKSIQQTGESINFKAVNYTELIPVLVKAIQEQQQQIDQLQSTVASLTANKTAVTTTTTTSSSASLQQNTPNPFTQNTTIRCNLPSTVQHAQLLIYSSDGRPVKSYDLTNKGYNEVNVSAGSLSAGQYIYTLIADGKNIDTKSMVLTK